MNARTGILAILGFAALLMGCNAETKTALPEPVEPTREAIGYYCKMIVVDHKGPKSQIHLKGRAKPVWFSSVRDGFAFRMLPGEPKGVTAFFVNDMGRAKSWDSPEAKTWIDARKAFFVIESRRRGGMGQLEAVPFGTEAGAKSFVEAQGGRVVSFTDMPKTYVLGEDAPKSGGPDHSAKAHDPKPKGRQK